MLGECEQQPEAVAIRRNCAAAGMALLHQALHKELLQQ
jgi:hypothetical protein